jgi:hypothetical protein
MTKTRREQVEPWSVPVTALVLGIAALVAFGIGGEWYGGIGTFVVLVGYATILVLGRRFESLAVLGGQDIDERRRAIGVHAAAWSAYVVLGVAVGESYWAAAHGRDAGTWGTVAALGGASFMASVVVLRRRQ